jgi:hypothetical protein
MTDDKHRRQWMAMLAKMVCPMDAANATKALCDMLPMMVQTEEGYFSAQSLAFVAGRSKRVPTFAELKGHFGAWWLENLPDSERTKSEYPRLEAPEPRRAPTDAEKEIAADLVRNLNADMASQRPHRSTDEKLRPKARVLNDRALLVEYEKTANDPRQKPEFRRLAEIRVKMLRERLGLVMEMQHAAE